MWPFKNKIKAVNPVQYKVELFLKIKINGNSYETFGNEFITTDITKYWDFIRKCNETIQKNHQILS
jgi:hypothetical protein